MENGGKDGESKNFETILKKESKFSIYLQKRTNPKKIPPTNIFF